MDSIVLRFSAKSVDVARFVSPRQTFLQKWRNSRVRRSYYSRNLQQLDLLQDRFERARKTRKHRFSTRFAAMLQNTLHVFAARFTVALDRIGILSNNDGDGNENVI